MAQNSYSVAYQSRNPIITSLYNTNYQGMRQFSHAAPYFNNHIPGKKTNYDIDVQNQTVTINEKILDSNFKPTIILPFDNYLNMKYQYGYKQQWRNYVDKKLFSDLMQDKGKKGIGFDIPIPIESQTFQKIFGGNEVGLRVTGNITINGGLRHEKRSEVKTAMNRRSNFNFRMEQTQRFTVNGNVGKKVNVSVDQDSERPFDFKNTIKLSYKGFEDEVIESIEAGNVSLSLPSTRYVTFSAKNSGLFGIKSQMRFGGLKMTVIASQEKGQKKRLSVSGGAEERENKIKDINYRAGTYFFLNYYFREKFTDVDDQGNHLFNPNKTISRIEVYKSKPGYYDEADAIRGWAIAKPEGADPQNPDTSQVDQNHYSGYFIRLEQNTDYFIEQDLGYIAMNQPLREGEVLAVAYRDASGKQVGNIEYNTIGENKPIILQMLRTDKPIASDYTWDLEWKNVYYLGTRNIDKEGFNLTIFYDPPSGDPQETLEKPDGTTVSYLELFGLDKRDINGNPSPDNVIDDDPNIINWKRGEIIFPNLEPFRSEKLPDDKRVTAMYDTTDNQIISGDSKFYISVSTKIRKTKYSLGFNVIENSEEIILDGRTLTKGQDYIVDYFSGDLTILDERASDPNADLEITYESNQMFQINRKTIFGSRWDYELPNNSFIGGTFLYLNQSTLDQKIRIGQKGPMQNFVWNLNSALNFDPYFITKGLNALPLIQTKEPSRIKFEGEIAQIVPNPNSQNNPATGDENGVVYIDDFEAAKRKTPLGVMRRQWTISSVPKVIPGWYEYNSLPEDSLRDKSRGELIWYNPFEQVPIKWIWPNRDVNANVQQRVHVLNLRFARDQTYQERSWAGLMRYLSTGYADQTNSKFLEVWVRGDQGRLHVDLGQISEDAIPNNKLNTEDTKGGIRNGVLDDGEDVGLDGVKGDDGSNVPGDAGNDDWSYTSRSNNYDHINGTEGNRNDSGGSFPDTEDLNQNGSLDLRNDYFEYSFSLDKNHPDTKYIKGGTGLDPSEDHGWRKYLIPLAKPDTVVGSPRWTNIEFVRFWLDEAPRDTIYVQIAEINLVGSEWKEKGMAYTTLDTTTYNTENDTTVRVSVVNTHENPDYTPPPGVSGVRDKITKVIQKEQALVLRANELPPGANGIIHKSFFQPQDYINYKVMKMFVHGLDQYGFHMNKDSSSVELFFRFGADERNYYEYREHVYPGWDERNEIIIDFEELTGLKNRMGDPKFIDKNGYLFKEIGDGDTLRVVGKPSLTNVRQMTFGVVNGHSTEFYTGEIWLNELRLTDVRKDKGMAMRARLDMKLADLINVNAQVQRVDDDFRTVNERFGKGNNRLSSNINASMDLDKFMPQDWGLSIPVNMGYRRSVSRPKYFPGSDIIVSEKTAPDTLLERIKSRNESKTFSVSLKKTSRSHNPFMKYTIDAMSVRYSYAESFQSNSRIKSDKSFKYNGNFSYNVNFDSKANVKPFSMLGSIPILKSLSDTPVFYLPRGFNYKFSFNRRKSHRLNRNGMVTPRYSFVINQSFNTGIHPFNNFSVDFNYSRSNDLRQIMDPYQIFEGDFGPLTSLSQSLKLQYNSNLASWLKMNLTGSTNFRYNNNIQQQQRGKSASNNVNYSVSLSFTPKNLLQNFYTKKPKKRRPRQTIPRKGTEKKEQPKEKEEEKEEEKEDSKSWLPMINPLKLFLVLGNNIKPISLRYSQKISSNNYGLKKIPPLAFQVGNTFNPGPVYSQNVGSNRGSFNRGYNIDSNTGIDITRQISISFKYSYDNSWNRTTTTTGSISDTRWRLGDKEILFPNWTLKWSGLEKLPYVKKYIQRASLNHGRTGRVVKKWLDDSENITTESIAASYRPLIGLNMTFKNGLRCNIQYNKSFSENINRKSGSTGTRKRSSGITANLNYSHRGGFKLPIPFLKTKEIKNNIDLSMSFTRSMDVSEQNRGRDKGYQEWTRNEKWSLRPELTYSFSTTVRGGMHFEYGKTTNKRYGSTRLIELGVNVNIQISGR